MKTKKNKMSQIRYMDVFFIIGLMLIPLLIMWRFDAKIVFFNNDDVYLAELVSGITTGTPESHLLHINILSGFFLSGLYSILPSVPWYGLFLFGVMYGSIIYAFSLMTIKLEKVWQKIIYFILANYIICSFFFFHLSEVQFTTVTTVVCMASLISFILSEDSETVTEYLRKNIASFIFFIISFSIRDEACIMIVPTFIFVGIVKIIKNKNAYKPILAYGAVLLGIIVLLFGIEQLAYASEPWNGLKEYNTARSQIMDYEGFPSYEENQALYEELGISEQSYISLSTRYQFLLDDNLNTASMEKILEVSKSDNRINILECIKTFIDLHLTSYNDRPLNILVYFVYIATICLILVSKKYKALLDVLALFLGRMTIWLYLLYIGRIMVRVTQGIYIVELMVLFAIIVGNCLWMHISNKKSKLSVIASVCVIFTIVFICHKWGIPYSRNIYYYNRSQLAYATCYEEMREYFNEHSNNVYLADNLSFSYFTKDIFSKEYESVGNFVLMGNWVANTPWTDKIAERYGIVSYEESAMMQDNVYFVFMESEGTSWKYIEDYYQEKYPGSVMEVQDVVETTFGQNFLILSVKDS